MIIVSERVGAAAPGLRSEATREGVAESAARVERAMIIDHIGSTSIPAMAAKDVLDLQLSVADLAAADAFETPLSTLGFVQSPYTRDHIPAGRDDDPARWAKRLWTRRGHSGGDANLHVRQVGSRNERLALLFRDWFRAHPEGVAAYAQFKRVVAENTVDTGISADIKDPVVDIVIVVAEAWAAETGWAATHK
jgi:GrpB-like predicted nucleotidyltransferase (UPF0157 family)